MINAQRYENAEPTRLSLFGSLLLALVKGIAGWLTGSKSLLADGFRSATETAADLLAWSAKYSGESKGYNSVYTRNVNRAAKLDSASTIIIAVVLIITGIEVGLSAIRDLYEPIYKAPHWSSIVAIMAGLIISPFLFTIKSGWTGLYCSILSLIGTGGALAGELIAEPKLFYCDPIAAMLIAVLLTYSGCRMTIASNQLSETEQVSEEEPMELQMFVQRIEGVVSVDGLRTKEQGHYLVAEMIIYVNPSISVMDGYEIGKRVKQLVMKRFIHIADVTVVVEPYDSGYPYKSNHDLNQEQIPTLLQ